jgi:hypothetical protein
MGGEYNQQFQGGVGHLLQAIVLVALNQGWDRAQAEMDNFIDPAGTTSIVAAVDASPNLGGACYYAVVRSYRNYGIIRFGNTDYLGVVFIIEVQAE